MKGILLGLLAASICVAYTSGLAVMSIDLGLEFMKIAIVKPGVPMEIALNKDSRRKTPVAVAFDQEDRLFGDAAMVKIVRYPKQAYQFLQDVLGKTRDNPSVARFEHRLPQYTLEEDPDRKTVIFKHNEDTLYTPEELMAMILETAKDIATDFAEQPVTDAVITVPPFFNQVERRAMIRAADLAGVKVLQLMNDNTATALNYGVFRRKAFNQTAVNHMFIDMGAGSTTASVVAYQLAKTKNVATDRVEINPQLTVKGVGYDRTLGGTEFTFRLRDHLVKLFNEKKKTKSDITKNYRSMAKLYKEAGRLKHVLSANNHHMSQVEGLLDDEDFRAKVTRAEFEGLCEDLFQRIAKPIEEALKTSQLTWDEISEVILMGAATRMPKVQEMIQAATGRKELGRSINTDEAAAMGAVYQAAHLSKGFRVKAFNIKDATIFPVQVEFDRVKTGEDGAAETTKTVKRTLFGRMNSFPQKKVMTFNKHVKDFSFSVNYADLSFMSDEEKKEFGATQLQKVTLSGVDTAYDKHKENKDNKGVKAHFRMDDSGILTLDKVESVFELPADAEPEVAEESTLQKLGSFFFGSSDKDGDNKVEDDATPEEPKEEIKAEKEEGAPEKEKEEKSDDKPAEKTEEPEVEKKAKEEKTEKKEEKKGKKKPKKQTEETKDTKTEETKDTKTEENKESKPEEKESEKKEEKTEKKDKKGKKEKTDKKVDDKSEDSETKEKADEKAEDSETKEKEEKKVEEKKPAKPTIVKEEIAAEVTILDLADPNKDDIKISKKKLNDLSKRDHEKRQLEASRNDLEAFIIEGQDRLYRDVYEVASTETEREEIRGKLSAASEWLEEQDDTTDKKSYDDKLDELKKLLAPLYNRVKEHEDRPRAVDALKSVFNYSRHFLKTMKNFTGEDQPFTETEYNTLSKLINTTQEWNDTIMAEQAKTPLYEKPKVLVDDLARKIQDLDREVKYLINKAKVFRPKKKEEKKEKKTNETKIPADEKTEKKNGEETKLNETKPETTDTPKEEEETVEKEFQIPDPPKEEEETGSKKSKNKQKEGTEEEKEEEEPLQIDGADIEEIGDVDSQDNTDDTKEKPAKKSPHDPDDEL